MDEARIPALDAARGLAASVVFIHHLDVLYPKALEGLLGRGTWGYWSLKLLSDFNVEAVMLFFIISGFCIRATSRKYNFSQYTDLVHYGRKRMTRIVPPYLIALSFTYAAGVAMGQSLQNSYSLVTLVGNVMFLQTPASTRGVWFVPFGGDDPLWSISFEVFYYAVFPAAILLETRIVNRFQTYGPIAALIMSFALSSMALVLYNTLPNPILLFMSLYCIWRIGVCAEDLLREHGPYGHALVAMAGLALLTWALVLIRESSTGRVILSGALLGIGWLILQSRPALARLAKIGPVRWIIRFLAALGMISYGLYLVHYPTLKLTIFLTADSVTGLVIGVFASLTFAALAEGTGFVLRRQMLSAHQTRPA
jgi:peptidoglycan/LPS O-acetylase OafA/YrhL